MDPSWSLWSLDGQKRPSGVHCCNKKISYFALISLWIKISFWNFSICSSYICAKLTWKFQPLLNQPASYGPFWPKLWRPLATLFVEIFWKEKNWGGFRPFPVTHWKEIWKYWKKWRFEIFQTLGCPPLTMSTIRGSGIHSFCLKIDSQNF